MSEDLRTIVAVFKINSDLERVGDLAVNVAEAAERYITHVPVKPLIDLPRMARIAHGMLRDALDAFLASPGLHASIGTNSARDLRIQLCEKRHRAFLWRTRRAGGCDYGAADAAVHGR